MRYFALSMFLLAPTGGAAAAEALLLARNGQTDYAITVSPDATPTERTAARELQEHLEQVTGAPFRLRAEGEVSPESPQVVVGPSTRLKQLLPEGALADLGPEGIVMKTVGKSLVLVGRRPRGTLYAVYTFLEDVVGCRWWTSTENFIPRRPTLEIPALHVAYAPPFRYREVLFGDALDGVFSARLKCNGHHHRIPPEYGGHHPILGWCHTFFRLLPPAEYFPRHPEWYSEINGQRTAEEAQLCLTNEDMRQELVRQALGWLRENPEAEIISISQCDGDAGERCQCARCRAVEEEEGSPSGPLLRFVNAAAAEIEKEFPEVLVETLAYRFTRRPPRHVRPRRNVVIRLCTIECSFAQPLATGTQNEAFRRDLEGWSAIAPHLYLWDYVINFRNRILPHPNLRVLAPNVRLFAEHQALGLFEQGDSDCPIGDFVRLRAWLLAHLMWDPQRDEEALRREFMEGYYGPAGPPLLAYLDLIHDAAEQSGVYLGFVMDDTAAYLSLDGMNEATRLFQKAAEAVAHDPVLARRVRRERMPLDHAWLKRYHALQRTARKTGAEFLGPEDPAAACEEFLRLTQEFQAGQWWGRFPNYEEALRAQFRPAGPPPEPCQGLPEEDWMAVQDHQFRLYKVGEWARTVDDANASDGKATAMPATHSTWAIQYPFSDDVTDGNPWRCYVEARCEAQADRGLAVTLGLYDTRTERTIAQRRVTIEECRGPTYRAFDLGAQDLHGGIYFWAAPAGNPEEVTGIYVDRLYLIREKPAPPVGNQ